MTHLDNTKIMPVNKKKQKNIIIYTDGGCHKNPGVGAWAFICPTLDVQQSGGKSFTTNNKMELYAAKHALQWFLKSCVDSYDEVYLHTDSKYLQEGITKWIKNWVKKDWKTSADKDVLNKDIWLDLKNLEEQCVVKNCKVLWLWVKGHDGNKYNEICDTLVTAEIEKRKSNNFQNNNNKIIPSFQEFSKLYKKELEHTLIGLIDVLCLQVLQSKRWSQALQSILSSYVRGGKMIRGLLTLYWAQFYDCGAEKNITEDKSLFAIAAVSELLHTFLIIHDDIMDKDDIRRNTPSMHVLLKMYVYDHVKDDDKKSKDFNHLGEALAICTGDILFSYCIKVLGQHMHKTHLVRVIDIFSSYVCKVGEAQMDDMFWESTNDIPDVRDILNMYEGKTGYYTFTLPSVLGYLYALGDVGVLHNVIQSEIHILRCVGNTMGKLFQICDDVLGIKNSENISGKPQGSDLIQKKKTFFIATLVDCAKQNNKEKDLYKLLHNNIAQKDVLTICDFADKWGVREKIDLTYKSLFSDLTKDIKLLSISEGNKKNIQTFANFITQRER